MVSVPLNEGVGAGAVGVIEFEDPDATLTTLVAPYAAVAVTVKVYAVPLVRPVTVIGELALLPVRPPGEEVAV